MKIYEQEGLDGIGDLVVSQASVAYCSPVKMIDHLNVDITIDKVMASANRGQIDLFYLDTILVSTGWNKNDDVFLADQVWASRHTPEDKQFNFMHNEKDIIGHITGSYVLDHGGNVVADEDTSPPKGFDIVTEAVMYKHWNDAVLKERMERIISEIQQDKWYVSMECLFSGFNYAMISEHGENLILERNETSAHLTKYLKAYGGVGEYEGYKLGRALSGISFSGKGLVNKPANPRSIILRSNASEFDLVENDFTDNVFTEGENQMSEILEKQVAELKAELAAAKAENDQIRKEVEAGKAEEIKALIADKETSLATLNEKFEAVSTEVAQLKAALEAKTAELAEANEVVESIKAEKRANERVGKLVQAGFEQEEAEESVALYEALDDETFEKVVAKFPPWMKDKNKDDKKKEEKAKDKDAEAKKDDDAKPKKDDAEAKKDAEEKKDKSEATEEIFDDAKAEEVVTDVETDQLSEARASIANWMEKHLVGVK